MRRLVQLSLATMFAYTGCGCSASTTERTVIIGSAAGAAFAVCVESSASYQDYTDCADAAERRMAELSDAGAVDVELALERAAADVAWERKARDGG